ELINDVFEVLKKKAEQGGVTLVQACPPELPAVIGDNDRLHQVLINLVDNAIKYTPAGGTVTVTAQIVQSSEFGIRPPTGIQSEGEREEEWLEITVADTGCGIPEADLPRLTQRFYRVDKARSRELGGTGLGLAIVKHIVQAHNGFLKIESQLK